MRRGSAVLIGLTMQLVAPEQPLQILQIYREALKPGQEAAWAAIEERKTRICLEFEMPAPVSRHRVALGPKGGVVPQRLL
jgi:hypothetical protein